MSVENKPITFGFYGDLYDYNSFASSADHDVNDYIAARKRGKKDKHLFEGAYRDMMNGIKDGSILFENGKFRDTKGRYFNYYGASDKDKNDKEKDYYGLMAQYIYDKMYANRDNKYTEPEDPSKIKFDTDTAIGKAYLRYATGHDTMTSDLLKAYIDRDKYDAATGKRALTERLSNIHAFANEMVNGSGWDSFMTAFTQDDKDRWNARFKDMMSKIEDKTLDAGDMASILSAIYGNDYEKMFYTGEGYEAPSPTDSSSESTTADPEKLTGEQLFLQFMDEMYPLHTFTPGDPRIADYNTALKIHEDDLDPLNKFFEEYDKDDYLLKLLRAYIRTPKEATQLIIGGKTYSNTGVAAALLKYLKDKGKLSDYSFGQSDPGSYYLPGSWTKGGSSGLVWNTTTGQVSEMDYLDIPYIWKQIGEEFTNWALRRGNTGTSTGHWTESHPGLYNYLRTGSYKEGGVLKALNGIKLVDPSKWYESVFLKNIDRIEQGLRTHGDKYADWLNGMQDSHYNIYSSAGGNSNSWETKAYLNDAVGKYQDAYKSGYENEFTDNVGYNLFGISNADNLHLFDAYGKSSRIAKDRAEGWVTDNYYSGITDWRRLLGRDDDFDEETLKEVVNRFAKLGYEFKKDSNGYYKLSKNPLIVDTSEYDNLVISQGFLKEKNPDIWLNPPLLNPEPEGSPETEVTLTTGGDKNKLGKMLGSALSGAGLFLGEAGPDLLSGLRLFKSINTNNRVARTLDKSLKPVLQDTYERYSPVTGAFGAMQYLNSLGNLVMLKASEPWVTDMEKTAGRLLEAQRQKNELGLKAFMIDDLQIEKKQNDALMRLEDNIARRTATAMTNRKSINDIIREKAQLEASRLRMNWQSYDNFLLGVEGRWRNKLDERNLLRRDAATGAITTKYLDALSRLDAEYERVHQGANASLKLRDPKYLAALQAILKLYEFETYNMPLQFNYRFNPYEGYSSRSYEDILKAHTFKKGGVLNTKAMSLINKVMRNENNS